MEYQTADVIVDALENGDRPYTQHNGKCGEMGERIHMSPNYLMTLFEEQKVLQYGKPGEYFWNSQIGIKLLFIFNFDT